ncbi:hypothetical protein SAMN05421505_112103 [Sinosporangium album]|uniref:Uncharacterized protein n=1 Tax=Sinosporangium album TaxID=504805 RepID=A0A1G8ACE4_9ACTN|nr:hypothetical protein SAMN05421505_112103 [Sinosporangium album]
MSRHVYEVGKVVEGEVEILDTVSTKRTREPYWLYFLKDDDGDLYKWWSPEPLPGWRKGVRVRLRGQVKRHDTNPETKERTTVLHNVHGQVVK